VVCNVYHEFVTDCGYESATVCLQIGDKIEWIKADAVELADNLTVILPDNPISTEPEKKCSPCIPDDGNDCQLCIPVGEKEPEPCIPCAPTSPECDACPKSPRTFDDSNPEKILGCHVKLYLRKEKMSKSTQKIYDATYKLVNLVDGQFALQSSENVILWKSPEKFYVVDDKGILDEQQTVKKNDFVMKSKPGEWTEPELELVRNSVDHREAVKAYRQKFPHIRRTYQDIHTHFFVYRRQQEKEKRVEDATESQKLKEDWIKEVVQEPVPEQKVIPVFKRGDKIRPIPGYITVIPGAGVIKRMNLASGDALIEFSNCMEWVKHKDLINYEPVTEAADPQKNS
jgi:hypothetical protein